MRRLIAPFVLILALIQPLRGQDLDALLEKADKLLEEAKAGYEDARAKGSVQAFVEAGFKLEEARIKYLVLQEIGQADKQKTAADRLRAVNQLGKLIHDGKVAVAGTPAEAPPKPGDAPDAPPAPATPQPKPAPLPAAPALDVSKRSAVPEAAKQRDAEKLVRDLFKEQYAKKAPADRKALARQLLEQALQNQDDPVTRWVLFREALDAATQGGDYRSASEIIEGMARFFDIDPLTSKNTTLAALVKAAKTPEEAAVLADAELRLADECFLVDQFDLADKACTAAVQLAKKSADAALTARAAARAKEVAEAKTKYQSLKRVLETLAKSPADPQANFEMGQFLCFVKGTWDLGLCFLAKGADPAFKPLADKELAFPTALADRIAIADGWWDLAQKESSPLRKSQLSAHATQLYDALLPESTGLVRVKIQKRLEGVVRPASPAAGPAPLGAGAVDLLKLIDPKRDAISGEWKKEKDSLLMPAGTSMVWLQIPYLPPDEYDLRIVATRKAGTKDLFLGVVGGGRPTVIHIDGGYAGSKGGIQTIDGKSWEDNESTYRDQKFFSDDKPHTVMVSVRKKELTVSIDGKTVIQWKADYSKLSGESQVPNPKALALANWESSFEFIQIQLATISGTGKQIPHAK